MPLVQKLVHNSTHHIFLPSPFPTTPTNQPLHANPHPLVYTYPPKLTHLHPLTTTSTLPTPIHFPSAIHPFTFLHTPGIFLYGKYRHTEPSGRISCLKQGAGGGRRHSGRLRVGIISKDIFFWLGRPQCISLCSSLPLWMGGGGDRTNPQALEVDGHGKQSISETGRGIDSVTLCV